MRKSNKPNLQKGETLVEAIIGLAVAVAIATGIVTAVVTALSETDFNRNSNFSLGLAQEGSDLVKDLASSNFTNFDNDAFYPTGYYCLSDNNTLDRNLASCPDNKTNIQISGNTTGSGNYLRKVYLNKSGCDLRKGGACSGANLKCAAANSVFTATTVSWADSKCRSTTVTNCHSVEIDTCLSDLNELPAP